MIVGEAHIQVRAITDKVRADIQRAFKDARPDMKAAGEDAGEAWSEGFESKLKAEVKNALTPALKSAEKEAESSGGRSGGRFGKGFRRKLKDIGKEAFSGFFERISGVATAFDFLGPAIAGLVGAIAAVGAGLFAMGSAAAQALPSVAALGGAMLTLAQAGGVLKIVFSKGLKEAIKGDAKALAELGPETRIFVGHMKELKTEFAKTKKVVQEAFFEKFNLTIHHITEALPMLQEQFSKTASILGQMGNDFIHTIIKSEEFEQILSGNNKTLSIFAKSMKPLAELLLKVGVALQPITQRFATWISQLIKAKNASTSIDGLKAKFKNAGDVAAKLGSIFGNLFGALKALGRAASKSGKGLFDTFDEVTGKWESFLKKKDTQKRLEKYFDGAAKNLKSISSFLGKVIVGLTSLGDNTGIKVFFDGISKSTDAWKKLGDTLTSDGIAKAMSGLINNVTELMVALTQPGQIEVFLNTLKTIVGGINLLVKAISAVVPDGLGAVLLGLFAAFRAGKLVASILGILPALRKLRLLLFAPGGGGAAGLAGGITGAGEATRRAGRHAAAGTGIFRKFGGTLGRLGGKHGAAAGIGGMLALSHGMSNAGTAAGGLTSALGGAAIGFSLFPGPVGIAAGAVIGFGASSVKSINNMKTRLKELKASFATALDTNSADGIVKGLGDLEKNIKKTRDQADGFTAKTGLGFKSLGNIVQGGLGAGLSALKGDFDGVGKSWSKAISDIKDDATQGDKAALAFLKARKDAVKDLRLPKDAINLPTEEFNEMVRAASALKDANAAASDSIKQVGNSVSGAKQSLASYSKQLRDQATALVNLSKNSSTALSKGASQELVNSLKSQGDAGAAMLAKIAKASPKMARQLSADFARLNGIDLNDKTVDIAIGAGSLAQVAAALNITKKELKGLPPEVITEIRAKKGPLTEGEITSFAQSLKTLDDKDISVLLKTAGEDDSKASIARVRAEAAKLNEFKALPTVTAQINNLLGIDGVAKKVKDTGKIVAQPTIVPLIKNLTGLNTVTRRVRAVGKLRAQPTIVPLVKNLTGLNTVTRRVRAVGKLKAKPSVVPQIKNLLGIANVNKKVKAVGKLKAKPTITAVIKNDKGIAKMKKQIEVVGALKKIPTLTAKVKGLDLIRNAKNEINSVRDKTVTLRFRRITENITVNTGGGGRANGGPVSAGTAYTVGEHGRELFVPDTAGKIISHNQTNKLGGGGSVNIVVNNPSPERASTSLNTNLRNRISNAGWGI